MPVLGRELSSLGSRHGLFVVRLLLLVVLSTVLGLTLWTTLRFGRARGMTYRDIAMVGRAFFIALFITELVLVWLLTASMSGGVIATEREHRTLDLLLITPMGAGWILFQKFLSRILVMLFIVGYAVPFLLAGLALGGVGADEVWTASYHVAGHGVLACGMAFFFSATSKKAQNAGVTTIGIMLLAGIAMPFIELLLGGARRGGPTFTMWVHPFYASVFVVAGELHLGEWQYWLPAIWAGIGVALALLAGRVVAVRSYVEPVAAMAGTRRVVRKRRFSEKALMVLRGLFLVGVTLLAVWICLSDVDWDRNHVGERPIFAVALWVLFIFILVRRCRAGLATVATRPGKLQVPDRGNPMTWKERNFVSFQQAWRADFLVLVCLVIAMAVSRSAPSTAGEAFGALGVGCLLIPGLLLVLGHFSAAFAREKEKKTLDLLVISTAPRTSFVDCGWVGLGRLLWPLGVLLVACFAEMYSGGAVAFNEYRSGFNRYVHDNVPAAAQALLSVLILISALALHGYFALWLSARMRKASTALAAAIGIPFLVYAILPLLEALIREGIHDYGDPVTAMIDPLPLCFILAADASPHEWVHGVEVAVNGVAYVVVAALLAVFLRRAIISRFERPPA